MKTDEKPKTARLTVDMAREDYLKLCGVARLRGESLSTTIRTMIRRSVRQTPADEKE